MHGEVNHPVLNVEDGKMPSIHSTKFPNILVIMWIQSLCLGKVNISRLCYFRISCISADLSTKSSITKLGDWRKNSSVESPAKIPPICGICAMLTTVEILVTTSTNPSYNLGHSRV